MNQHVKEYSKLGLIREGWIILDNQSTVSIFCDCTLLKKIRRVSGHMNIHCNTGIASTNWVGYVEEFGTVWHHKEGIANILSLAKVQEKYHVKYASQDGNALLAVKPYG